MRILGLVVGLLLTISVAAAALTYGYTRQDPIYLHANGHSSPAHNPYNDTGYIHPDSGQIATGNPDPYLQRYHSHSEGWTYYNLPRFSNHQVP
jgi:hypothetical protein